MDERRIKTILKHIKDGYYDKADRTLDVIMPLMIAFGPNPIEVADYLEKMDMADLKLIEDLFEYLIGEFLDSPYATRIEAIAKKVKEQA